LLNRTLNFLPPIQFINGVEQQALWRCPDCPRAGHVLLGGPTAVSTKSHFGVALDQGGGQLPCGPPGTFSRTGQSGGGLSRAFMQTPSVVGVIRGGGAIRWPRTPITPGATRWADPTGERFAAEDAGGGVTVVHVPGANATRTSRTRTLLRDFLRGADRRGAAAGWCWTWDWSRTGTAPASSPSSSSAHKRLLLVGGAVALCFRQPGEASDVLDHGGGTASYRFLPQTGMAR